MLCTLLCLLLLKHLLEVRELVQHVVKVGHARVRVLGRPATSVTDRPIMVTCDLWPLRVKVNDPAVRTYCHIRIYATSLLQFGFFVGNRR